MSTNHWLAFLHRPIEVLKIWLLKKECLFKVNALQCEFCVGFYFQPALKMRVKNSTLVCVHRDLCNKILLINSIFISTSQMIWASLCAHKGRAEIIWEGRSPAGSRLWSGAVSCVHACVASESWALFFQCYMHDKPSLTSVKVNVPWMLSETPEWHMMKLPHVSGMKCVIWVQGKNNNQKSVWISFFTVQEALPSKCPIFYCNSFPALFPGFIAKTHTPLGQKSVKIWTSHHM